MQARRLTVVLAAALALMLAAGPAFAQAPGPAQDGRGSAYGARLNTALGEVLGPEPSVEAAFPPGESDEDVLLEVPADPVLNSGTLSVESQAEQQPSIEAKLQQDIAGQSSAALPEAWNARGYAIAEELTAVEQTLTADVVEGEAVASCVDGQPVYATGANLVNASLGGSGLLDGGGGEDPTGGLLEGLELTADQPNNEVIDLAGVKVVTWETNWDGADGTTDGSDTVWVNGLHVTIDLGLLDAEALPEELQGLVDQLLGSGGDGGLLDGTLGGAEQLEQGAEAQDEEVDELEAAPAETQTSQPEPVEADAASTQEPDTGAVAQLLQGSEDVQVQQEGDTVDLIVSHAEAEVAACGPGDDDLGITKDVSSDVVAPGDTFSYTITIPNDRACTIENLEVVDAIQGPAGSEVVGTTPQADDIDNMTVTWNDLGPIAPGDSVTLGIDVRVPADAPDGSVYTESVTASGECDGQPVDGGLEFEGPTVQADRPPPPDGRDGDLPRTGGGLATSLGGLLLLAAGAGLARVTRRP